MSAETSASAKDFCVGKKLHLHPNKSAPKGEEVLSKKFEPKSCALKNMRPDGTILPLDLKSLSPKVDPEKPASRKNKFYHWV